MRGFLVWCFAMVIAIIIALGVNATLFNNSTDEIVWVVDFIIGLVTVTILFVCFGSD